MTERDRETFATRYFCCTEIMIHCCNYINDNFLRYNCIIIVCRVWMQDNYFKLEITLQATEKETIIIIIIVMMMHIKINCQTIII